MRLKKNHIGKYRLLGLLTLALTVFVVGFIPVRLAIARHQAPQPEIIFMLGGGAAREEFSAEFAQLYPDLKVWVSSGSSKAAKVFSEAGISPYRLHFDCRATDTVTNFTTVVGDLQQRGIQHVFMITSDNHISRATAIATIVFGSHGITVTPIAVPSSSPSESWIRAVRDVGRSIIWVITGRTGASLNTRLQSCEITE